MLATVPGAEVDAKPAAVRLPKTKRKKSKKKKKKKAKKKLSRLLLVLLLFDFLSGSCTTWIGRAELLSSTISSIV